ncbi:UNVERIFIED_CONTAM: hypothetical protein GTU68_049471 [Idotea baltica]|nr:hypothetical protein [Idotea baltica]
MPFSSWPSKQESRLILVVDRDRVAPVRPNCWLARSPMTTILIANQANACPVSLDLKAMWSSTHEKTTVST